MDRRRLEELKKLGENVDGELLRCRQRNGEVDFFPHVILRLSDGSEIEIRTWEDLEGYVKICPTECQSITLIEGEILPGRSLKDILVSYEYEEAAPSILQNNPRRRAGAWEKGTVEWLREREKSQRKRGKRWREK